MAEAGFFPVLSYLAEEHDGRIVHRWTCRLYNKEVIGLPVGRGDDIATALRLAAHDIRNYMVKKGGQG